MESRFRVWAVVIMYAFLFLTPGNKPSDIDCGDQPLNFWCDSMLMIGFVFLLITAFLYEMAIHENVAGLKIGMIII